MISMISFLGLLTSLVVLTYARLSHSPILVAFFKTLCSLLFLSTAYFAHKEYSPQKNSTYYKLLMLALVFSLFGDIFLLLTVTPLFFLLGVFSFACAHLSFTFAFFQFSKLEKRNLFVTSLLFFILISLMLQKQWFDLGNLKFMIMIYSFLLSFMTGKSISVLNYKEENFCFVVLTLAGAILFFISDFILLFVFFAINQYKNLEVVNNIIYFIGQGLFALSLRHEITLDTV